MKKLNKIFWVLARGFIKSLNFVRPTLYMRLYNAYLKSIGVDMRGIPQFIHPTVRFDGKDYSKTHLGDGIIVSRDVYFLIHDYSITCGLRALGEELTKDAFWLKEISIGDNCFIGAKALILPGTVLGKNCIVGGGAVVKGIVPDNSIVVGNPAKIVANTIEWASKKKQKNDYYFNK